MEPTIKSVLIEDGGPNGSSRWLCTVTTKHGTAQTEYTMGAAYRMLPKVAGLVNLGYPGIDSCDRKNGYASGKRIPFRYGSVSLHEDELRRVSVPEPPDVVGVLYSLVLDAECGNETFEDFCGNFGYDTDSRKALETYLACQESVDKLRKLGGEAYVRTFIPKDY